MLARIIDKTVIYRGRKVSLSKLRVELPNGRVADVETVEYKGSVAILAFVSRDRIILLEQYRPVIGKWHLEIPAGTLNEGEDPVECAIRELEEETGYTPKKLYKLGGFYLSPGYSTEYMHIFVAEDLVPGRAHPEPSEVIKLRDTSIEEAISMVKKGIIDDAKTVLALLLYQALHI